MTIFNDKKCSLCKIFKGLFIGISIVIALFLIIHIDNFILMCSECLANHYISKHNYKAAEKVYLSSLALQEKLQPSNHYPIADSMYKLANFYDQQFMPAEEEKYLKKYYFYVKQHRFSSSHLSIIEKETLATILDKIGKSCLSQEKYNEAENYFKWAYFIRKEFPHAKNKLPILYYLNIAPIKLKQNKLKEAKNLYFKIYKNFLYDPKINLNKNACGIQCDSYRVSFFYQYLGNYKKAEEYAHKTLNSEYSKHSLCYSDNYSFFLSNLAVIYKKQGKFKKAEELFKKVIFIDQKKNSRSVICDYYNLASLYKDMKDNKNTEIYLNKALLSTNKNILGLQDINKNQAMNKFKLVCRREF